MLTSRLLVGAGVLLRGALGLSPPYTTPGPECRLNDPAAACPTYANCYNVDSGCTSSGCPGGCAPISSCTMGSANRTCEAPGQTCTPFYTTCTTNGCFGACIDGTAPTPTPTYSGCKIGDPLLTCSNTKSYCSPTGPCNTIGCGGQCQPSPTGTPTTPCVISDPVSTCAVGMTCTQTERCTEGLSGCHGYCTPTYSPTPTLRGCKIGDLTSTCSPTDSYTCTPTSPCTTTGCGGLCLSLSPSPTFRGCRIGDPTSTCSPGESYTCTPTSPCTTTGCDGVCISTVASPTVITDPPFTDTNTGGSGSPNPTEPPLKTRTYDCLVSVTAECLPGYSCEPWYGQCCNSLNCPGRCVKKSTDCGTQTKEVLVTTTVTVWQTKREHGH